MNLNCPSPASLISHLSSLISHLSSLISHLSSLISHLSSLISHLSSLISHLSSLRHRHKLLSPLAIDVADVNIALGVLRNAVRPDRLTGFQAGHIGMVLVFTNIPELQPPSLTNPSVRGEPGEELILVFGIDAVPVPPVRRRTTDPQLVVLRNRQPPRHHHVPLVQELTALVEDLQPPAVPVGDVEQSLVDDDGMGQDELPRLGAFLTKDLDEGSLLIKVDHTSIAISVSHKDVTSRRNRHISRHVEVLGVVP
eukprot:284815666_2